MGELAGTLKRKLTTAGFVALGFILALPIIDHENKVYSHKLEVKRQNEDAQSQAQIQADANSEFARKDAAFHNRINAYMFTLDCTTPGTWLTDHPTTWPTSMVIQPLTKAHDAFTWDLVVKPWSMDKRVIDGGVVQLLCMKGHS